VSPETDGFEPDERQVSRPGKILSFPRRSAPEWLTGPADGLNAASDPGDEAHDEASPETLPRPVLRRPAPPAPIRESAESAAPGAGEVDVEDVVDAEEVSGSVRPRRAAPPGIWAPVASSVPTLKLALPDEPEPVEVRPAAAPPARFRGLPGHDEDLPRTLAVAPPPPLAPLHEPWWIVALDGLRTSRPVQLGTVVGLAALVLLACWSWPRGVGTTSLTELRRYPSRFDGRTVTVRGRAGDDVFAVGAGWAFYLVQGRDTIVTFTRTQMPRARDVVTVKGQVSTGFLDGVPRQALFEDTVSAR
jgi:hypothetical protein